MFDLYLIQTTFFRASSGSVKRSSKDTASSAASPRAKKPKADTPTDKKAKQTSPKDKKKSNGVGTLWDMPEVRAGNIEYCFIDSTA